MQAVIDTGGFNPIHLFVRRFGRATRPSPVSEARFIQQLNSHVGLVWAPNSQTLYATGGCDDAVYAYTNNGTSFFQSKKITLGHAPNGCISNSANQTGLGLSVEPNAAGLAITADGATLVVANNYNDSISIIDTASATVRYEYDLRPFYTSGAAAGTKGGTFPFAVVMKGSVAYVGADRDREVIAVNVASPSGSLVARIPLDGNPNGMALSADGSTLFVAQDNQDQVAVINTASNRITHKVDTRRSGLPRVCPPNTTGAATTAVTINYATRTLYAVNAGSNSIAVIPLSGERAFHHDRTDPHRVRPDGCCFQRRWQLDVHRQWQKSDTGPNPGYGYGKLCRSSSVHHPAGRPLPGRQRRRVGHPAGQQPISIPVGTRNSGQRAGPGDR